MTVERDERSASFNTLRNTFKASYAPSSGTYLASLKQFLAYCFAEIDLMMHVVWRYPRQKFCQITFSDDDWFDLHFCCFFSLK